MKGDMAGKKAEESKRPKGMPKPLGETKMPIKKTLGGLIGKAAPLHKAKKK